MKTAEIYDLECLANLFTYTGYNYKEKKYYQYVICDWRNDYNELYDHVINSNIYHVGYNNKAYDSPLLHHLLRHYDTYSTMSGFELALKLYEKSQKIIEQEYSELSDDNEIIPQIDLYKIWHYNNLARSTS